MNIALLSSAYLDTGTWATAGLFILGWGAATVGIVIGARRARDTINRHRALLLESNARRLDAENQVTEFLQQLSRIREELAEKAQQFALVERQLANFQKAAPTKVPQSPLPTEPEGIVTSATESPSPAPVAHIRILETDLKGAQRSRLATEQKVRQLAISNQELSNKNCELAARIDDTSASLEETRITLSERQRELADLSRRLQSSEAELTELRQLTSNREQQLATLANDLAAYAVARKELEERKTASAMLERMLKDATEIQVQAQRDIRQLTADREHLELQNIELKLIVDQLAEQSPRLAVSSSPSMATLKTSTDGGLTQADWSDFSDREIGDTVALLAPVSGSPKFEGGDPSRPNTPSLQEELRQSKLKLQIFESSMGDLEYLREQNARLRQEMEEDRGAARELLALQLEHKRLKLDFELAREKVSSQLGAAEELSNLQMDMRDLKGELETVHALREQIQDLRAENFALRNVNSGTYRVVEPYRPLESDLRELSVAPLDTAVLADQLGLPIAVTGNVSAESLAAVSGLATRVAAQVRELLPLGPIVTVQLRDRRGMAVTCRLVELAGDNMAMTTIGEGNPSEQALNETLRMVLGSIGWTEDGPIPEALANGNLR
jgi:hypothetical protein